MSQNCDADESLALSKRSGDADTLPKCHTRLCPGTEETSSPMSGHVVAVCDFRQPLSDNLTTPMTAATGSLKPHIPGEFFSENFYVFY